MEITNGIVKKTIKKKDNILLRFLKAVFVSNIGCKISAIILSVALWIVLVGLGVA